MVHCTHTHARLRKRRQSGQNGLNGEAGPPGPPGEVAVGTIAGKIVSTVSSKALDAVAVVGEPGDIHTTSASDGSFSFPNLPAGAYTLTFTRDGYIPKTIPGVGVSSIGTTNLAVSLDTDAKTDGPTIVMSDNLLAGFASNVTLTANVTDTDSTNLTYAWTLVSGHDVTFAGGNTNAISFTTLALTDAKSYATYPNADNHIARFGPMGFSPDETGNYVFKLTVSDPEGHTASAQAKVMATAPGPSLRNVAVGLPLWFQGDSTAADAATMTSWSWTLDTSKVSGSTATLSGANTQFPSFTPDKIGTYTLTESVSGKSMDVYAGNWRGISGGAEGTGNDYSVQGCISCHNGSTSIPYAGTPNPPPDMFTPWRNTKHAQAFSDGIDGVEGQSFGPECLQCHTLGNSSLASNAGFDDIATKDGWTFPTKLQSGNWNNMVSTMPDLAQLGNVQCESCHGPQTTAAHPTDVKARVSFSVEVCATCHQEEPFHYKVEQWQSSRHSDMALAVKEGSWEKAGSNLPHCGRCHSGQGFSQYAQQLNAGYSGYLTTNGQPLNDAGTNAVTDAAVLRDNLGLTADNTQPQVCASCHDPHNAAGNPAQLRVYGAIASLPNGQTNISGVGAGAVCMGCHNQRNGWLGAGTTSALPTPHDGPQTDIIFGVNAFFIAQSEPSPHLAIKDTCTGCHYAIPRADQAAKGQTTNHAFKTDLTICNSCHSSGDGGPGQVDGVGLQSGVKNQLLTLDKLIFTKMASTLAAKVTANGSYVVSAQDTSTNNYLCASAGTGTPTFTFTAAPNAANMQEPQPAAEWRALTTLWISYPTLNGTLECTSTGALSGGTYNGTTPLKISVGNIKSANVAVFALTTTTIIAESIWNESLLHNDHTWGVHNFPFYTDVINATTTQLNTLP